MDENWVDILQARQNRYGNEVAYRFLPEGKAHGQNEVITYTDLLQRAQAIGAGLQELGAGSERILLVYPAGLDFISAFFGTLFAGAIPVPVQAPVKGRQRDFISRFRHIVEDCRAGFALTDSSTMSLVKNDTEHFNLMWIDSTTIPDAPGSTWRYPGTAANDLAFLQYTSGSTRNPRGVRITHANLTANCRAIANAGFAIEGGPHIGWMPHYHDMGLVGGLLCPLFCGVESVFMSPLSFARKPIYWLEAIDHFAATASGGPVFAYSLTIQKTSAEERAKLDLTSWQVAYCGAEPIRDSVLQKFSNAFADAGFRETSFLPCYGMAETTLFVTGRHGRHCLLYEQESSKVNEGKTVTNLVSVGKAFDDTQIRIVDPESGYVLPENQIGEIWLKGPGLSPGYFHDDPDDSPFNRKLNNEGGFFSTGDLGILHEDELYICGRRKDLIIIRGQNFYPQDLEYVSESVSSSLEPNSVAAFSPESSRHHEDKEQIVIVAGTRRNLSDQSALQELARDIKAAVVDAFQVTPHAVAIVHAREIPRTSSGKVRRFACRNMWQREGFNILAMDRNAQNDKTWPYGSLTTFLEKLDKRNTNYQFDLEEDIDWADINNPGRYFSDDLLAQAPIDILALKSDPQALAYFEWALALLTCRQFVVLEDVVVDWANRIREAHVGSKSLELLDTEEQKHIKLFNRYADALISKNPDEAKEVLTIEKYTRKNLLDSFLNPSQYENEAHYHYTIWLGILYFEEHTLWIDESLNDLSDNGQKTWKQAHSCHRREESQHVLTDKAYIQALGSSHGERLSWSKYFFQYAQYVEDLDHLVSLVEKRFPHLQIRLAQPYEEMSKRYIKRISHPLYRHTRAVAPYIELVISGNMESTEKYSQVAQDNEQRKEWLRKTLAKILGCSQNSVPLNEAFTRLGLDSLGHLNLASKIEEQFGLTIKSTIAFSYPTIDELAMYLNTHLESP